MRKKGCFFVLLVGIVLPGGSGAAPAATAAEAESSWASRVLPENTVLVVDVPNVQDLADRFDKTAMGHIMRDDQIRPLLSSLYGSAADAFDRMREEVGAGLDDVLGIPGGEVCFALVPGPETGVRAVLMLEVGEDWTTIDRLIDRGGSALVGEGARKQSERVGGTTLITYQRDSDDDIAYAKKDNCLLVVNDTLVARQLLETWAGSSGQKTLADSRKYAEIRQRCAPDRKNPPQINFFVDPVGIFRANARGDFGSQVTLGLLPSLGLDGLNSIGFSATLAPDDYDSIVHAHLIIDNPREAIMKMLALDTGDMSPESWVPEDTASYSTSYWDVPQIYTTLAKVYDSFKSEGALDRLIERNISDKIDIDFKEELIEQLKGRITTIDWFDRSEEIPTQANAIAVTVKDTARMEATLRKLASKYRDVITEDTYGGQTYYRFTPEGREEAEEFDSRNLPPGMFGPQGGMRMQRPCVMVFDGCLIIGSSPRLLERVISTHQSPDASLSRTLDYSLVKDHAISYLNEAAQPGGFSFQRPEEGLRWMYSMLTNPDLLERLAERAERRPDSPAAVLHKALEEHPLPPFAVIRRYVAPGGAVLVDDHLGWHYYAFGLKRQATEEDEKK
ncbi:MAG: hypothetical protein R3E01_14655 [Pirellulaceae bacterium]